VSLPRQFWLGLGRTFIASFGVCSITWAFFSLPYYRAEAALYSSATGILAGESYTTEQLARLDQDIEAVPQNRLGPVSLRDIAIVRLRQFEEVKALDAFERALTAVTLALAADPNASFLWMAEFSLRLQNADVNVAAQDLALLDRSYVTGPYEGWVAVRRNPMALAVFQSLPNDLAEQTLSEFAGIVRSGLYLDAANILAGSGWPLRDRLLARVRELDEASRRGLAGALAYKNIDLNIPGVDNGSSRPF
jgi:hypothetical protein